MASQFERLKEISPDLEWAGLPSEAEKRFEKIAAISPLYLRTLERFPAWIHWLERADILNGGLTFPMLGREWDAVLVENGVPGNTSERYLPLLRRFRRKISMRIAYRDVGGIADQQETTLDLSRLAEFCVGKCLEVARENWTRRLGVPWDEHLDEPARFCIIALGKLGGRELNFSSDIDLIFLFEGDGHTRKDNTVTGTNNAEYFQRVGEALSRALNARDSEGFLFRTDLRLRPGGAMSPLVPSMEAVENYYAAAGQTWERLALLKARPIAGDVALGAELMENLQSFRYPRHPPASLLADVAAMKLRTEREVLGHETLARDVKSGYGGIREIEFFVQSMQLLRAGQFPFLQTSSTTEAIQQLVRYQQMESRDAVFLEEAYWFLRQVEHRIQMMDEQQTHELPEDDEARTVIARSLGFNSLERFDERMANTRRRVRNHYLTLFRDAAPAAADALSPWWAFFAHGTETGPVPEKLKSWFGDNEAASRDLRTLVRGSDTSTLMKDQVQRFIDLIPALDRVMPRLADPIQTFRRVEQFAQCYGSRTQFFASCVLNPVFLEVIALLFDRSVFIFELLREHVEIFDEVLRPEILRKRKEIGQRVNELGEHPGVPEDEFISWLWLYIRAEQVRAAIGQLLGFYEDTEIESELSDLAEATLISLISRIEGADRLGVVALGKFGGRELSFGSDLDVVFVGDDAHAHENYTIARRIARLLSGGPTRVPAFELDLRLRPHGESGALVPSLQGFRHYFEKSAQCWERQVLTRARFLTGPPEMATGWQAFVDETVFENPISNQDATELWNMRMRVQKERDVVDPPARAFKTGAGGLIDIEFALQILQLRHGHDIPEIQTANTARGWQLLAEHVLVEQDDSTRVLANLKHIKRIEFHLRRVENRSVSVIPTHPEARKALICWLGGTSWDDFWSDLCERMEDTRAIIIKALTGIVDSTTLETHR